ncbi:DHH family phosphoesterase [Candidatus Woesearchaeota archaeon]|nr:DHH family phosphoesterase [Candidatus Woesearchaeota archaeon]
MALSKNQIHQIREGLDSCKNPLFFFDDDQDGLCSFLQLYRYKGEGKGIIVKTTPKLGSLFARKVEEYHPDKVFILDLAAVEQEFLDGIKVPVIWIDHHSPAKAYNVKYFNPRVSDYEDNQPTSYMCYQAAEKDLWIATIGCVADWFIPPFIKEFKNEFPDLAENPCKTPGDVIYNTKLGLLIRIFSFILKGKTDDVMKNIKVLSRIAGPYEILNKETAQGRFIYKHYEQVNKLYEPLIKDVLKTLEKTEDRLVMFTYKDDRTSFTSDLSNEAIYRFPDKIILIAREKNDEMKCSLRSAKAVLPPIIDKCLVGLEGYGGGHEHACGLNIKTRDFEEFVRRLRELI